MPHRPHLPFGPATGLALALLLAGPAAAAPQVADHKTTVTVSLQGPVEVPLVSALDGSLVPCVWVQFGDDPASRALMALEMGDDDIVLSDAAIARLGGVLKGKEDAPFRTARFEKVSIGGLQLTGLEVVNRSALAPGPSLPGQLFPGEGAAPEGTLGLGALRGLSWSIEPSAGRVRFRPGADGPALLAELGGQSLPLQRSAALKLERPNETLQQPGGLPLAPLRLRSPTPGTPAVEAPPVTLALSTGRATSSIEGATLGALPAGAAEARIADRRARPLEVQLGGLSAAAVVSETSHLAVYQQFKKNDLAGIVPGWIGADVLGQLDLAYDPGSDSLALRAGGGRRAASPVAARLADAEAALQKSIADTKDSAEGKPKGTAAAWTSVAAARRAAGDLRGAVQAHEAAAQLDAKSCAAQLSLGQALMAIGEPAAAETALTAASTLWHAWGDLSPEVRSALDKPLARAKKSNTPYFFRPEDLGFVEVADISEADVSKGAPPPKMPGEGAEITVQPSACHQADAWLAAAQGELGRGGAALQLYAERYDLDPNLALVAGNALLARGEAPAAMAPFRQSIKSFGAPASPGLQRVGLAIATHAAGGDANRRGELAAGLAAKAAEVAPHDPLITETYATLLIASEGPAAATAALRAFARARPRSVAAQLAYLRAAQAAADPAATAEAQAATMSAAALLRALDPEQPAGFATLALAEAAAGDPGRAAAAAAEAVQRAPGSALSHIAAAAAARARGDQAAEAAALKVARRLAPFHPGLAAQ
jgi:predicted Zn-dependent protease